MSAEAVVVVERRRWRIARGQHANGLVRHVDEYRIHLTDAVLEHMDGIAVGRADEKVQVPIAIRVAKRRAGQAVPTPQRQGPSFERAVSSIPEEPGVVAASGHNVDIAVTVDVASRQAATEPMRDTRFTHRVMRGSQHETYRIRVASDRRRR